MFVPALLLSLALAAPAPDAPACESDGAELVADARLLFRVVACAGDAEVPAELRAVVDRHCAIFRPYIDAYAAGYAATASAHLAALQPSELPDHILYPFGGGDLVNALTVYPFAREVNTISLELPGDPRRLRTATAASLEAALDKLRPSLIALIHEEDFSRSVNLSALQRGLLPSQLCFFLVGLAAHGYTPVSLRYLQLSPTGQAHYLASDEIDELERTYAKRLRVTWDDPDFSVAFANVEMAFVPQGEAYGPVRIHRHFGANLGDPQLKADPRLLLFLNRHGPYTAMTKAASYLLWMDSFSVIRNYLLGSVDYMVSESSGIPSRLARPAGFLQDTYGTFTDVYLAYPDRTIAAEMRAMWASQPTIPIPFRFGYPDRAEHNHLLITYRIRPDWTPEFYGFPDPRNSCVNTAASPTDAVGGPDREPAAHLAD